MEDIRFSVVVPTRDRAETLYHTLRTCLVQDFDSYEVVVHDNCSPPSTREAVERLGSERVRYHRSDEPLAMTDSWERALSFARGEYVILIGDDDGLVPRGLPVLDQLLREHDLPLVRWVRAAYHWPNHPYPPKRNSLKIPLGNAGYRLDGRRVIREVANLKMRHQNLPMLYNSAVHRDLIKRVAERCGRVFHSLAPDVGSGVALAYLLGEYLAVESPFSIGGTSGKSAGLACATVEGPTEESSEVFDDFKTLNERSGRGLHPSLPPLYLNPVVIADSFYRVKEKLFPDDRSLQIDRRRLLANCLHQVRHLDAETERRAVAVLRESAAGDPRLARWFEREVAAGGRNGRPENTLMADSPRGFLARDRTLCLDPLDFGVSDVYGAAELCDKVLCYGKGGFRCEVRNFKLDPYQKLRALARVIVKGGPAVLPDCD